MSKNDSTQSGSDLSHETKFKAPYKQHPSVEQTPFKLTARRSNHIWVWFVRNWTPPDRNLLSFWLLFETDQTWVPTLKKTDPFGTLACPRRHRRRSAALGWA